MILWIYIIVRVDKFGEYTVWKVMTDDDLLHTQSQSMQLRSNHFNQHNNKIAHINAWLIDIIRGKTNTYYLLTDMKRGEFFCQRKIHLYTNKIYNKIVPKPTSNIDLSLIL